MESLSGLIEQYGKEYPREAEKVSLFLQFLRGEELSEELSRGHFTGSAWVINRERTDILMTHHAKLNLWLQPGGHLDEGEGALEGALREVKEETGLTGRLLKESLFDLDIHLIPARKSDPAHYHFDIRFFVEADSKTDLAVTEESHDLKWIPLDQVQLYNRSDSILRMVEKTVPFAVSPVFGSIDKEADYRQRVGVYGLICDEAGRVALMKTFRGYFLPGGGIDEGESHEDCLKRELIEEAGWDVSMGDYIGLSHFFGITPSKKLPMQLSGHYYRAERTGKSVAPVEEDHEVEWFKPEEAAQLLRLDHQAWAVRKAFF
ncbi:MAG: NUDIX domain-containing protein [Spirochaetales bacterium]|nr:NUDIX domain-containing protein [Spirochaetales bacterium]